MTDSFGATGAASTTLRIGVPHVVGRSIFYNASYWDGNNTAANAACKIDAFDLRPRLDLEIGAFGSDHHDRNELVPVAVGRAEERYGAVDMARVWVIGDTPFDAACARAGGVRCLLVASGHSPRAALEGAGADHVVDDLADTDAILGVLGVRA